MFYFSVYTYPKLTWCPLLVHNQMWKWSVRYITATDNPINVDVKSNYSNIPWQEMLWCHVWYICCGISVDTAAHTSGRTVVFILRREHGKMLRYASLAFVFAAQYTSRYTKRLHVVVLSLHFNNTDMDTFRCTVKSPFPHVAKHADDVELQGYKLSFCNTIG